MCPITKSARMGALPHPSVFVAALYNLGTLLPLPAMPLSNLPFHGDSRFFTESIHKRLASPRRCHQFRIRRPDITSAPSLNALSNAARATRWSESSASQSATMTVVSIAVVIPRHVPQFTHPLQYRLLLFRCLDCRFPRTSRRDSLSVPLSRACPFRLPQIAIGLRPYPSRRRTSRGMVICPLLVTFACFFIAALHFLTLPHFPYFCPAAACPSLRPKRCGI